MPAQIFRGKAVRFPPWSGLAPADWTAPTRIGYAPVGRPQGLARRGCAGL